MRATCQLLSMCLVLLLGACATNGSGDIRSITILYTNDEHGWMAGTEEGKGAASLMQQWKDREGYTENGPFLILSGGDNWTGPAVSTRSRGESMVQVMSAMGYDASAVGNHEFDFGLDNIRQRALQAAYPYLSANTRWRKSGEVPTDLGIFPYHLKVIDGVRVAIIGLTTLQTATATLPTVVAPLEFLPYEPVLRQTYAQVQTLDPDLVVVISHICMAALFPLAESISDLNIAVIGGGHCNELVAQRIGRSIVLGGGYHFTSYAMAELSIDLQTNRVLGQRFGTYTNEVNAGNQQIASVIHRWQTALESELSRVIAFLGNDYDRNQSPLQQAIMQSWLAVDPTASVALTNAGGLRANLQAGAVTAADVFNLMPFDNTIIAVEVTGRSLVQALEQGLRPVYKGIYTNKGRWFLSRDNQPVAPDTRYRVLVNSFMYAGGDGYGALQADDPNGFDLGISYREPFTAWLEEQGSSEANVLYF